LRALRPLRAHAGCAKSFPADIRRAATLFQLECGQGVAIDADAQVEGVSAANAEADWISNGLLTGGIKYAIVEPIVAKCR
jgi:hypothetical protein